MARAVVARHHNSHSECHEAIRKKQYRLLGAREVGKLYFTSAEGKESEEFRQALRGIYASPAQAPLQQ